MKYPVKPKRDDLIDVYLKTLDNDSDSDQDGDFIVEVVNGTAHPVSASIIVESNLPMLIEDDQKILNDLGRVSTMVQTKTVTVPAGETIEKIFHWRDPDDSLKFLRVRAMFKSIKSTWINI